jgi:hypothetical protein
MQGGMGTREVVWMRAVCTQPLSMQFGFVVLRPDYVAFLPTTNLVNFLGSFSKLIVSGTIEGFEAKLPIDLLLDVLHERHPLDFDATVREVANLHDGILWEPGNAEVAREPLPLQPSRTSLVFSRNKCTVNFTPPRDQAPLVERLLQSWAAFGPIPVRQPTWKMVIFALLFTIPALLCAWSGMANAADPERKAWDSVLPFVFAGTLGAFGVFGWVSAAILASRDKRRPAQKP